MKIRNGTLSYSKNYSQWMMDAAILEITFEDTLLCFGLSLGNYKLASHIISLLKGWLVHWFENRFMTVNNVNQIFDYQILNYFVGKSMNLVNKRVPSSFPWTSSWKRIMKRGIDLRIMMIVINKKREKNLSLLFNQ